MPHPLDGQYNHKGHILTIEVSPCSWMYPHYGLQFQYRAADGRSWGYVNGRNIKTAEATKQDVQELLEARLIPEPCEKCQTPHLYNKQDEDSPKCDGCRRHKCEKCFLAELKQELDAATEKDAKREKRRDAKMKKDGYTHKVAAWIHPGRGDDYQVNFYWQSEPTDAEVQKVLKGEGSTILTDYRITAL